MEFLKKFKDFVYIYKVNLVIGVFLLLLILIGNFSVYYLLVSDNNKDNNNEPIISIYHEEEKETTAKEVEVFYKVDIKGAVKKSGVYQLKKGSRVIDVITLAGGVLDSADTSVTNLSKYISDEMVIVIYTKDEVINFKTVLEEEKQEENKCIIYNEVIQNDSCKETVDEDNNFDKSSTNDEIDIKVSINTANIELLMTLPGVGESKAKSIIEYREQVGIFKTIEEIMNVSGIGEKLFESIKNYITV